jgi:hypothetical protein
MRVEGEDRKRRIKSEEKLLPIAPEEPKHYRLVLIRTRLLNVVQEEHELRSSSGSVEEARCSMTPTEAGGEGSDRGSSGKVLLALDELTAGREKAVGALAAQSISRLCVGLGSVLTTERESNREGSESPGRLGVGGGGSGPRRSGRYGRCGCGVGLPRLDPHVGACCWTTAAVPTPVLKRSIDMQINC